MRICDVSSFYSPRAGGVRTYHNRKLEYFLRRPEHDYTLVYADRRPSREVLADHARIIRVAGPAMGPNYHFIVNPIALRKVFNEFRPQIVEIGEPYILPWVTRAACLGRGIPVLGYWHADFPITYVRRPVERINRRAAYTCEHVAWWYARRGYGRLAAVLCAADAVRKRLVDHGLTSVYHAPLGVDRGQFTPARRDPALRASVGASPLHRPDGRPVLLFPHRLTEEKGLSVALEAFDLIRRELDAVLVVAGTGPGEPLLREHMRGNPHIHYLGYLSDPGLVARWYASCDLVFALSPYETFGLTALEGMAAGCLVVAADSGALPELVEAYGYGMTVPHNRPALVAEAAVTLLARRSAPGAAPRQVPGHAPRHHDWEAVFDNILRCYADVLSGTAAQPAGPQRAAPARAVE